MSPSARARAAIWLASQSGRQASLASDVAEDSSAEPGVRVVGELAEIRDLASLPEQSDPPSPLRQAPNFGLAGERRQRLEIARVVAADEAGTGRRSGQAGEQPVHVREVEIAVAPAELCPAGRSCAPPPLAITSSGSGGHWAVLPNVPSRIPRPARPAIWPTSGGLRRRGRCPSNLDRLGEGDMVHVHVQPHPDRVRRDQEVHLLFLIERHLGVAGAGREPAHHHGATARAGGGSSRRSHRPRRR